MSNNSYYNDQWRIINEPNQNKVSNYSMEFDGTNDVVNFGNIAPFNAVSTKFSVSLWCKSPSSFAGSGSLVDSRLSNALPDGIAIDFISNTMSFRQKGGTFTKTIADWGLNNANWNHIVFAYDLTISGANNVFVYINNSPPPARSMAQASQPASTGDFKIGDGLRGNFNGSIDQVNIFDYTLSASQVSTLSAGRTAVTNPMALSPAPVAYYQLGDQSVHNGANYLVPNNSLSGSEGYSPYALDFDGIDYLDCGNITALNNQSIFCTSTWINYSGTPTATTHMFLSGGSAGSNRFFVMLASSSKIRYITGGTTKDTIIPSINSGDWHHIVTVHDGTSLDVYLDSVKQNSSPFTVPVPNTNIGQQFKIGAYFTGAFNWNGKLSNTAIWNTVLSQSEITEIYNSGLPSDLNTFSGTAPISWWQLGSNSSYNSGAWTCLDEIGTNNAVSAGGMTNDDITNGVGYSANGLGTSSIDIKGDAPYSSGNGLSENMDVLDRVTDVPS